MDRELFGKFFQAANGIEDPLSVLATGLEVADSEVLKLSEDARAQVWANVEDVEFDMEPNWLDNRNVNDPASSSDVANKDYEGFANIAKGQFEKLIVAFAALRGKEKLSFFDYGAGTARAFGEILSYDVVDKAESAAVTLPSSQVVDSVRDQVATLDATFLAPRQNGDNVKRFDVVTSLYGVAEYSPMNGGSDYMFGVLQALNFLEVGGLLIINHSHSKRALEKLVDVGILAIDPGFMEFSRNGHDLPFVYILNRRPTYSDIRELLHVESDGLYEIY